MPVKNNITGLWRHYKLANMGSGITTGCDANGSLTGDSKAATNYSLKDLFLIVNSANSSTEQTVSTEKLLVGTPKTKVVNIGKATDSLDLEGPLLFTSTANTSEVPDLIINDPSLGGTYGDAGSVAAAMLYSATNFTTSSFQSSYAKSVGVTVDESGAKFNIGMVGDPTSLFADFSNPSNSIAPFGYDKNSQDATRPQKPLDKALRVGTFYDFFVEAQLNVRTGGSGFTPTWIDAAVRSISMNINIDAEQISLLGMGQAPYFAINQVAMEGSMKIVFPILQSSDGTFPTTIPTWQSLPNVFGTNPGSRYLYDANGNIIVGTDGKAEFVAPLNTFPDAPDKFVVDTVTIIPLYRCNGMPLFADGAFGSDLTLSKGINVVMKNSKVNIGTGVLEADMSYSAIFTATQ